MERRLEHPFNVARIKKIIFTLPNIHWPNINRNRDSRQQQISGKFAEKRERMFIAVFRQWTGRKGGGEEEGIAGTTLRLIFHSTCFYFLPSGVARKRRGLPRTGSDTRCVRPPPPFFVFSSSKVCPRCAEGRKRDKGRESSINRRRTYTSKAAPLSKLGEISEFRSMAGGGGGRSEIRGRKKRAEEKEWKKKKERERKE